MVKTNKRAASMHFTLLEYAYFVIMGVASERLFRRSSPLQGLSGILAMKRPCPKFCHFSLDTSRNDGRVATPEIRPHAM